MPILSNNPIVINDPAIPFQRFAFLLSFVYDKTDVARSTLSARMSRFRKDASGAVLALSAEHDAHITNPPPSLLASIYDQIAAYFGDEPTIKNVEINGSHRFTQTDLIGIAQVRVTYLDDTAREVLTANIEETAIENPAFAYAMQTIYGLLQAHIDAYGL